MNTSMTPCFRESQTPFTLYHTPYQSGLHDTHDMSASTAASASMVWSPFQAPTPADCIQRVWRDDGKVEISRRASNWKAKRVTVMAPRPLQAVSYTEFINDPPSIHLELSDCSICTPIFEDREI